MMNFFFMGVVVSLYNNKVHVTSYIQTNLGVELDG